MLARRLDGTCEPESLDPPRAVQRPDLDELQFPLGHGAGLVEDDGADPAGLLENLRAFDHDAELRAAPGADHERGRGREPERAGQAMMSTATDAVKAAETSPVTTSQPTSVASAIARTIGTKMPETRSARRWIGAFPA